MLPRYRIPAALVITGAAFLVIQQQLVRELLVTCGGNELIIGLLFGIWLLAGAAGSLVAARLPDRGDTAGRFVITVLLASVLSYPTITVPPFFPLIAGVRPGTATGLWYPLAAATVFMAAPAFLGGMVFTSAARLHFNHNIIGTGRTYLLEAAGAGIGGVAYFLAMRASIPAALIAVTAGMLLVLAALLTAPSVRTYGRVAAVTTVLLFMPVLLPGISPYDGNGTRTILRHDTPYGRLRTDVRDGQFTISVNGTPAVSIPAADPAGDEEYRLLPLLAHPRPASILIVSGRGYPFAASVATAAGTTVTLAEAIPGMVAHQRRVLPQFLTAHFSGKVRTVAGDARRFVAAADPSGYDIVYLDLPPAISLMGNRLQTLEFHRMLHTILGDTGIVALHVPSSLQYLGPELDALHAGIESTLRRAYPYVRVLPGEPAVYLAGTVPVPGIDDVLTRFDERGYRTAFVTGPVLTRRWTTEPGDPVNDGSTVNRDLHARGVRTALAYWESLHHGRSRAWSWLLLLIPAVLAVAVLGGAVRGGFAPLSASLLTSGIAGMGLQLLLLVRYQTVAGTLYGHLALLTGLLMAGIIPGVILAEHVPAERTCLPDAAMAAWTAVCGGVLLYAHHIPAPLVTTAFDILAVGTGAATGFQFSAGARMMRADGSASRTGSAYAADLAGACLAAMLFSGMLVPRFGMPVCVGGLVMLKITVMALRAVVPSGY